jgi:SulP family sulfate permease
VVWSALPQLTVTLISMTMVVALSSSLDIAAIELELNQKLDYDSELTTVGVSNLVSGLTGGYTGSYIFSQTIFTLRSGVRDRYTGFTVALCEGLIVIAPFPVIAYIPKMFFGSLLVMICTDLMVEWLWQVREKLTSTECVERSWGERSGGERSGGA